MKKNILLLMFFFFTTPLAHAATFTVFNYSGRDILVKPFWLSTKVLNEYVKLPAGQKASFNSGLHSVEHIEWITDEPGKASWIQYRTQQGEKDKILDALKTMKEFHIYEDGQYRNNFNISFVGHSTIRGEKFPLPFELFVERTRVHLTGNNATYLVVENYSDNLMLIKPPVKRLFGNRGFVSGDYDCIPARGSKLYNVDALGEQYLEYIVMNSGKWYAINYQNTNKLLGGKIFIQSDGAFTYIQSNNTRIERPANTLQRQPIVAPIQCQLSK